MTMRRPSLIALGTLALLVPAAAVQAATPVYYNLPSGVNVSQGIAAAPNGDVWFAADGATSPPTTTIGRLRPSLASPGTTNGLSTFPTPIPAGANCCANRVTSVAFDSVSNTVWFVQNDGVVGNGAPDSMVPGTSNGMNAIRLPGYESLYDVAVAKGGGAAWITEYSTDNVNYYGARIALVGQGLDVTEFDNIAKQATGGALEPSRYDPKPAGITIDGEGHPWFAEADPGNPGYRIAQGTPGGGPNGHGTYSEYLVTPCGMGNPCSGSYTGTGITDVAVAPDGSKWFTNQLKNQIGRFDGATFTNFDLPVMDPGLSQGQARAITAAPDGTLWVVEYGGISHPDANAIIRIDPSNPAAPTASVYHLGAGHAPFGVAPDGAGNVWFTTGTDAAPSLIGELPGVLAGAPQPTPPPPLTPTPAPVAPLVPGPPPIVLKVASRGLAKVDPPQVDHGNVLADQICAARDGYGNCTVIYSIARGEYVTAFPGAKEHATKKKRAKGVVVARKKVTTKPGTHKKVKIVLNAAGRKLLKKNHKLVVYFTAEQAASGGKPVKLLRKTKLTLTG